MSNRKLKAVFFDMDGVLYDSMKNHAQSWTEAMMKFNIDYQPYSCYLNEGRTGFDTINWAFNQTFSRNANADEQTAIKLEKTRIMNQLPAPEILPGIQSLIQKLKSNGITVMVVTGSNQKSLIDRLMSDFYLLRSDIITGADISKGKPDAEPYLKALEKCKCKANEAIIIENAPLGIQSGKSAKIFTVAVNTGILENHILMASGADMIFKNTESLALNWNQIVDQYKMC